MSRSHTGVLPSCRPTRVTRMSRRSALLCTIGSRRSPELIHPIPDLRFASQMSSVHHTDLRYSALDQGWPASTRDDILPRRVSLIPLPSGIAPYSHLLFLPPETSSSCPHTSQGASGLSSSWTQRRSRSVTFACTSGTVLCIVSGVGTHSTREIWKTLALEGRWLIIVYVKTMQYLSPAWGS